MCLDSVNSGLGDLRVYFRYNATSGDTFHNTIKQLNLENMGNPSEFCQ